MVDGHGRKLGVNQDEAADPAKKRGLPSRELISDAVDERLQLGPGQVANRQGQPHVSDRQLLGSTTRGHNDIKNILSGAADGGDGAL